jgi:hypothetical protein
VQKSEKIDELAKALTKAQAEFSNAKADSTNPHFKSHYADLESVRDATYKALSKHGLCLVQHPEVIGDVDYMTTLLLHDSGQWLEASARMNPAKNDPQGMGSAITYFRRYCQTSMLNIAQTDDDANTASQPSKPKLASAPADPKNPGDYVIPFGKFVGKRLKEVPINELKSYAAWLYTDAKKKNQELRGESKQYFDAVDLYSIHGAAEKALQQ